MGEIKRDAVRIELETKRLSHRLPNLLSPDHALNGIAARIDEDDRVAASATDAISWAEMNASDSARGRCFLGDCHQRIGWVGALRDGGVVGQGQRSGH
jgi:hypothetical protein